MHFNCGRSLIGRVHGSEPCGYGIIPRRSPLKLFFIILNLERLKMIKSILQSVSNRILYMLQNANSIEDANKFYRIGLNFDNFCISGFGYYLD